MKGRITAVFVTLALVLCFVAVPAQAATPDDIEASIEAGITFLVSQQSGDGSWESDAAVTGLAVIKLEDRAFELGFDSPFDEAYPYHQNVIDGLNFIFGQVERLTISVQPAGDPDSNGNTYGAYIEGWEGSTYWTGISMMAIAGSRSPDDIVPSGIYAGSTYKDVLQDMVDYLAWGQDENEGAWFYEPNEGVSDQSNSGYAVLGLEYAEASLYGFNCSVPAWVKTELSRWIDIIQNPVDGDEYDGGSAYSTGWGVNFWVNLLKTGNLLGQMAFVGDDLSVQRVQDAMDYIALHWYDANLTQGWGWSLPLVQYQAAYCLMKGLSYMGVPLNGIAGVADWYQDLANEIIAEQLGDGSWESSPTYVWPDGSWGIMSGSVLSTEWALLTLERFAPPPPVVIEVSKGYTYTNVCFERDNDLDGLFSEDPVDFDAAGNPIDNDGDGRYNEDPVDCPSGTNLGDPLPTNVDGAYVLKAVVGKNNKVSSYNPGQFYAVSTVNILADIDRLTIVEDYDEVITSGIGVLNPANGGGRLVVVRVGDDGQAYQILDASSLAVSFDGNVATIELGEQEAGTTILVYVKFGPGLHTWTAPLTATNTNGASIVEDPEYPDDFITANAVLILNKK